MSDTLKVPKDKLRVTVHLEKSVKLHGFIFLEESPFVHALHQKIGLFLKDESFFFPLISDGGNVEFINKAVVLMLECEYPSELEQEDYCISAVHIENVFAVFCDGSKISGTLMADVPEDKARLSDCLNLQGRFLRLKINEKLYFLNKDNIQKVRYADRS